MNCAARLILVMAALVLCFAQGRAQEPVDSIPVDSVVSRAPARKIERKVTPVETIDRVTEKPTLHYYDKHGEQLEEPVLFLAELDTIQTSSRAKPIYPKINGLDVGINIFDAIMAATGQKHGSFDAWAALSIFNWFFPTVEIGSGYGSRHDITSNYNYRGKGGFYLKAGFDYNFLYKSNPAYRVFLGLRAAVGHAVYDIDDITISSDYWGETNHLSITGQRATMVWGEALGGIKVKIVDNFALGWTFRYRFKMKNWWPDASEPWVVPGFGNVNGSIGATFSLIYTFSLGSKYANTPIPETLTDTLK